MVMGPEVALGGTTALIRRSALFCWALVKAAMMPLNRTLVAPLKFVPESVTLAPGSPMAGENCEPVKSGVGVAYQLNVNEPIRDSSRMDLLAS